MDHMHWTHWVVTLLWVFPSPSYRSSFFPLFPPSSPLSSLSPSIALVEIFIVGGETKEGFRRPKTKLGWHGMVWVEFLFNRGEINMCNIWWFDANTSTRQVCQILDLVITWKFYFIFRCDSISLQLVLSVSQWVSHWLIVSDLGIAILSTEFTILLKHCQRHNGPRVLTPYLE